MSFALVAFRPSAQSPGWRAARWKLRRGVPARKLGRIQSRGRNRRAGWIDSNSLGTLKSYFTSVRATEQKTGCCIVAPSAITHWQYNLLGRIGRYASTWFPTVLSFGIHFSRQPVCRYLATVVIAEHFVATGITTVCPCSPRKRRNR